MHVFNINEGNTKVYTWKCHGDLNLKKVQQPTLHSDIYQWNVETRRVKHSSKKIIISCLK